VIDTLHFEACLHHVGFVVGSIEKEIAGLRGSLLASWDAKVFHDPLQKVRVTFLQTPGPTDALIELVEPAADDSPAKQFLGRGGGLHHLCYEVSDLDAHLAKMAAIGAVLVRPPLPAVAFENRRIAWIVTSQRLLLEFLDSKKA
jgi:methylmalonyl-CoA/ethylmalonyl-CoA epimerase